MQRIMYTRPNTGEEGWPEPFDGGVSIVAPPSSKENIERSLGRTITDEEYMQITWDQSVPSYAIDPQYIDEEEIKKYLTPKSNDWKAEAFRDAFKIQGSKLIVDMEKAKVIHMRRIIEMIQKKFIIMGFPQRLNPQVEAAIVDEPTRAELQRLRNIPQTLDLTVAKTPEEIKLLWPVGVDMHPIYIR